MPKTRASLLTLVLAFAASLAAAQSSELDQQITNGKLQADLGNWKGAAAAFETVARDPQATAAQQWEALVRLGIARRALGDARGSVAAFEKVMAEHADDPEALRFLALSVGGSLPGRERWDAIWREVRLEVDRLGSVPTATIVWPGVGLSRAQRRGWPISIELKDANLADVYRFFADFTGLNVVVQPGVLGQVTIRAKDEPWQDVLERIVAPNGYGYSLEGNVLWIGQADYVASFGERKWSGKPIDVDFRNEDLRDVLSQLALHGGLELQFDPRVAGHVTFRLVQVPWDQALELVLRTNGLVQRPAGRQVLIAPRERS